MARTTQLAWTITLVTLGIFVVFIIPEQKRTLAEGLESKARSVSVALQGEVAGAAVTEDYSSVVEHAMRVVEGDPSVEFLVINKSDGYALLIERGGWKIIPQLDTSWRPAVRTVRSGIGEVPLVGKRVFQYSDPFEYAGIAWGWIHVGLSLESYDKSVKNVYRRTTLLAVVCIALGLVASVAFARKFVQPVLRLRAVVEEVAGGDLSARANISSNDEIEQLAHAFNDMADAVLHRNRIVESVRYTAQALQGAHDWRKVMDGVVAKLGQAANVSRVLLVQHTLEADGLTYPRACVEWCAPGVTPYGKSLDGMDEQQLLLQRRIEHLSTGQVLVERRSEFDATPTMGPEPHPLSSIAAPVVAGSLWGVLLVQDCYHDRDWLEVELDSARTTADMLGASILRQRAQDALVEAKSDLEQRVLERTFELSEQIVAKDRAHAELQQAQKQLMELSRQSGMAEIATGVLHNVGNVLNSINVSASLFADQLRASRLLQLNELTRLLTQHQENITSFLKDDPRGQRVLPYLAGLSDHLLRERDSMSDELQKLLEHVNHVKEIVSMQQSYARSSGVLEKLTAESLLEDALNILGKGLERHRIELVRDLQPVPQLTTDRHKVLQILLNLLRNAKDAVKAGRQVPRRITVRICDGGEGMVRFEVEDNGVGIEPGNLASIFSHGFTTKKDGHGFGLHSGALAAKLLGGSLQVKSDGLGQGARFTLDLPIQPANEGSA